jgi:membrane associated rhomboid family serine protease
MAFILFLMLIGGGIFLMAIGKDGIGLTTALTGLATSIGLFLTQKSKANKELKSKALKETQDK